MNKVKVYDILSLVIDGETNKLGSNYRELEFNKKSLEKVCILIDGFMDENGAIGVEVNIAEETLDILVSVICPCFEYDGVHNSFMEIVSKTKCVSFEIYDEDNVKTNFVFNGVWDK